MNINQKIHEARGMNTKAENPDYLHDNALVAFIEREK